MHTARVSLNISGGVSMRHDLAAVLASGFIQCDISGVAKMPGLGFLQRNKAHCTIRLTDGLWHCFRYADPVKAAEYDAAMLNGLLG